MDKVNNDSVFAVYTNIESCCTPETNIMLYINYISIFFKVKDKFFKSQRAELHIPG